MIFNINTKYLKIWNCEQIIMTNSKTLKSTENIKSKIDMVKKAVSFWTASRTAIHGCFLQGLLGG